MYYLKKKYFKSIFLFHKYISKTTRPLKGFYGILLNPSYDDKTFEYCFKGTYGVQLSDLITEITEPTMFLDIGSNQGLYSVLAGKNIAIDPIFSFEPNPKVAALLLKNATVNQMSNHQIIEAAISEKTGATVLHTFDYHSGKGTLREVEEEGNKPLTSKKIKTINHKELNEYIPAEKKNVIKIDVEGHEEVVISELIQCDFLKNTQWIFCEIDEKWINPQRIIEQLKGAGFSHFERMSNHPSHYDLLIRR